MQSEQILIEIEREITRLQEVRNLLAAQAGIAVEPVKRKPGRPPGSGQLSSQGRKRIAEAMRRSWAKRKAGQ